MKSWSKLKRMYNALMSNPHIPESLRDVKEPLLLHISDIPVSYHPFVYQVIQELKPQYLIHTGDLVDNIKLEKNPQLIDFYVDRAIPFLAAIEAFPIKEIYLIPGNHDHLPTIHQARKRIIILEEGKNISIENTIINAAHHPWNLGSHADFYLYGHNFDKIPGTPTETYLNGLEKIRVLLLHSKKVMDIDYPYGINQDRKMVTNKYFRSRR